jgi:autotransporter-associated beta strand protein
MLTKSLAGELYFGGSTSNSYSGMTVVSGGRLLLNKTVSDVAVPGDLVLEDGAEVRVYNREQINDYAKVTINGSGVLRLSNLVSRAETIGSLTGSGSVVLENALFSVGGNNTDSKFTGLISGNGTLTKEGTGVLLLGSRTNIYSSATTVAGGTLLVDAYQPWSDVTVSAQGNLGGRGTVGDITLSGGRLAPGSSPGLLTCSNVTFSSSSKFDVELNGTTVGSGYDQLRVRGTVSLGNSGLYVAVGFTPAVGNSFIIINNDGTDPVAGTFKGLTNGATLRSGLVEMQVKYDGGSGNNDVVLTVTKVDGRL